VAEERRRRRRGHRRGRGSGQPEDRPAEENQEGLSEEPEAPDEERAEGGPKSRFGLPFGRGNGDEGEGVERERRPKERQGATSGARADVSPLGFWRRGRARTYRDEPMPKATLSRTLRRLRGMYFPPWVPVAFIIVLVFGILGLLFIARSAAGAPRNGDHWHATYSVFICGQRQPNFPTWEGGVHTHADGIIHIHPFTPSEEGAGARLMKWFEYGGGKLTGSEMRMPGDRDTYRNGDTCDDGTEAILQLFVNGEKLDRWDRFIPQDGDQVRIVFGPEQEEGLVEEEDRTIIPESEAARTEELEITGGEGDAAFSTPEIAVKAGETVKFVVKNSGSISHSLRVSGPDVQYDTKDDFVVKPEILQPGEEGVLVVRFDEKGEYPFQDPSAPAASGKFVVGAGEADEEEPDEVEADVTLDVTMTDSAFAPAELEVEAGKTFRINLVNDGSLVHNMRLAGPDGEFETEDDILSTPGDPAAGEDGSLVGKIDRAGTYAFRSDFQPTEMVGTLTVK
jgi:plastocyanin